MKGKIIKTEISQPPPTQEDKIKFGLIKKMISEKKTTISRSKPEKNQDRKRRNKQIITKGKYDRIEWTGLCRSKSSLW